MKSESKTEHAMAGFDSETEEEPKDRTRWVWLGIIAAIVVMIALMGVWGNVSPDISVARVRHILIAADFTNPADQSRAYDLALEIREQLVDGASFEELARQYSNDPGSSRRGGDLGWVERGQLEDPVDSFVWAADIGEISQPVRTGNGYHIIQVLDRNLSLADQREIELREKAMERLRDGGGAGEQSNTQNETPENAPGAGQASDG